MLNRWNRDLGQFVQVQMVIDLITPNYLRENKIVR